MTAVTGNVPSTACPAQLTPAPGRYEIDTSCSAITFTTRHLFGAAPVRGSFAIRFGIIEVADPLPGSSVYAQVSPASFRTGQERRDRKVRSARLLDADRYPVIAFTSEQVDSAVVSGELTVRNVTMPASLRIESCTLAAHSSCAHDRDRVPVPLSDSVFLSDSVPASCLVARPFLPACRAGPGNPPRRYQHGAGRPGPRSGTGLPLAPGNIPPQMSTFG
jgi:polyisoprenoid-binding protein YceI